MKHPDRLPALVFADSEGNIFDHPHLKMAVRRGLSIEPPQLEELIPLPAGSELFVLPGTLPVGWDADRKRFELFDADAGSALAGQMPQAVAAFMAPAHTMTGLCAFEKLDPASRPLPLFAYAAVGWWKGRFWAAGFRSDSDIRQDPERFNQDKVAKKTMALLRRFKKNRLIQHLGKCSLTYGCPAAKNLFLGRFEAPLPTSPVCNARCLGCLSSQPPDGPPATQDRITFVPSPADIAETALIHINRAKRPVVSFGQGCEGEPLMQASVLSKAVRKIRKRAPDKGTINLNTNASRPDALAEVIEAGLDSIRISLNSVRRRYYAPYYRPKGYSFDDVLESWRLAKQEGLHVSLNLFVFPGLTDEAEEFQEICSLIDRFGLDLIQLRNHNIDPEWYLRSIGFEPSKEGALGILGLVRKLKMKFPGLRFGYFNPALRD